MQILAVDESKKRWDRHYYFSLVGLIVDSKFVLNLEKDLEKVKENYGVVNLKELRQDANKSDIKLSATKEIAYILKKYKVKAIAILLVKQWKILTALKKILKIRNPETIAYEKPLELLLERFSKYIENIQYTKKNEFGIVIFDSCNGEIQRNIIEIMLQDDR